MYRRGRNRSANSDERNIFHVVYENDGAFEALSFDEETGAYRNQVIYDDPGVKFKQPQISPEPKKSSEFEERIRNRLGSGDIEFIYDDPNVAVSDPEAVSLWDKGAILQAVFVRLLLIGHNVMTAWRVVEAYDNDLYWLLALGNALTLIEGVVIIVKRGGVEYSWWCPCFACYLSTTLPGIWLLQLHQNTLITQTTLDTTTDQADDVITTTTTALIAATNVLTNVTYDWTTAFANVSDDGTTPLINVTTEATFITSLLLMDSDVWIIIIQEALVYLLVLGRWMLPRGKVTRDFLADLLLEFLAIASDIMELFAVFDEDGVRADRKLTYAILVVWTASFIQFVPILMQKRRFRHVRIVKVKRINALCGDKFVEVVVTCMSIFLQDGPFLVVRLFIMIHKKIITYSLVFFVLKNIVTLLLLFYRLAIVCYRLPGCYGEKGQVEGPQSVDFNHPVSPEELKQDSQKGNNRTWCTDTSSVEA